MLVSAFVLCAAAVVFAFFLNVKATAKRIRKYSRETNARISLLESKIEEGYAKITEDLDKKVSVDINDRLGLVERRSFRQLESLLWLQREADLHYPIGWTRGWAASPDFLLEIYQYVVRSRPQLILELGSGVSSIVIASALRKLGTGRLISIDHDENYGAQTRLNLESAGLDRLSEVRIASLKQVSSATVGMQSPGGSDWVWYDQAIFADIQNIDMVVIDGPPEKTGPLARYPAVPLLIDKLNPRAMLFLDDAARAQEREILGLWEQNFSVDVRFERDFEKGLARISFPSAS